jgi:alpha-galactosidase
MSDPSVLNSIRNTINRFWMHRRIWLNDPDCLLVRETDTAMTEDEVRSLATVIGMTGGMVLDSDNLAKLSPDRRRIIASVLPAYGESAVPLDFFRAKDVPQILELDCGTHRLLGVFNWEDEAAIVEFSPPEGRWHAFEFWTAEYLGVFEDTPSLTVPSHGCRLIRLTPDFGRPQVVGSTLHMTMGAMELAGEEWDGERLRVALRPVANREGALYIWRADGIETVSIDALTAPRMLEI